MSQPTTESAKDKRQRRLWLTVSEIVGVLALAVAGLNYWDTHREHTLARKAASEQVQAQTAFVMTGDADSTGDRIVLAPLNPAQAIQSQRYLFPKAVLDHAMEVSAARPQIDKAWIERGLKQALDQAHAAAPGEAKLPVGVITTYVEAGDTHVDRSIYQVGYAYRARFLAGMQVRLEGLSLARRAAKGDLQAQVEQRWAEDQNVLSVR